MITLAFGQMLFFLATSLAAYGGDDGLTLANKSLVFGQKLIEGDRVFYYVVFGCLLGVYLLGRSIVASRFGRVLRGTRENATRMEAIGYHPFRYQLTAYVISGMMAGLAGFLLANQAEFVSPAYMTWQRSGELIFMVILGGMASLHGAVLGAAAFLLLEEYLAGWTEHWKMIFGPLLILGRALRARRHHGPHRTRPRCLSHFCASTSLRKAYGALVVTDDVSLEVRPGELHAIIGPNGAGKTTLIHQMSGLARSDSGRIVFDGHEITRLPMHERVRRGLARSFQITSILPAFSALENVALAVQARSGSSFRMFGDAAREEALNEPALAALNLVNLGHRAHVPAGLLSHGEKRQLELAVALATEPKLLLLDEPLAGTGHEESERVVEILRGLKGRYTIVLIEHDMEAVFALADRVSVLVYGRVIATDTPARVRANAEVRAAYLGEEAA
jgi:branched-chain amino acid transport system ATP-binding protein